MIYTVIQLARKARSEFDGDSFIPIGVSNGKLKSTLTLGSGVRPLRIHSSVVAGDSTEVALAASTNDSLIMFTVNCFVLRIFSRVSFGLLFDRLKDMLIIGGLCETYRRKA